MLHRGSKLTLLLGTHSLIMVPSYSEGGWGLDNKWSLGPGLVHNGPCGSLRSPSDHFPCPECALGMNELGLWNKAPLSWGRPSGSLRNCLSLSRQESKSRVIFQPSEDSVFARHAESPKECREDYAIISPSKSSVWPLQNLDLVLSHDRELPQS